MLGMEQERWLSDALAASTKAGKRWQVLAQQVLVGTTFAPPASTGWVRPETAAQVMPLVKAALAIGQVGMPSSMDTWGGYPAARSRLLKSAQEANANLVVLAGDSHNAWAFDLSDSGAPAGVEFGGTSVTSPGYEAYFSADPAVIAREIEAVSPELRWADTSRRGYMHVTLTPDEARSEWRLLETVRQRSTALAGSVKASTRRGTNTLELA
jgi:alkaline phosphatase D